MAKKIKKLSEDLTFLEYWPVLILRTKINRYGIFTGMAEQKEGAPTDFKCMCR